MITNDDDKSHLMMFGFSIRPRLARCNVIGNRKKHSEKFLVAADAPTTLDDWILLNLGNLFRVCGPAQSAWIGQMDWSSLKFINLPSGSSYVSSDECTFSLTLSLSHLRSLSLALCNVT